MNKKILVAAIAVASAAVSTSVFAATNLGSATQKGSLLIFPRVEALESTWNRHGATSDTLIQITNDSSTPVNLKCYWGTTEGNPYNYNGGNAAPNLYAAKARTAIRNNHYMDFGFTLTKNQPVSFWAGSLGNTGFFNFLTTNVSAPQFNFFQDGTSSNAGELKCWAVNSKSNAEVHHNHLIGKATIVSFANNENAARGQAHEYNASAFQAHFYEKAQRWDSNSINYTGRPLPTPFKLDLDGKEYDQCASALVGQFIPTYHPVAGALAGINRTQISVANCHEDLRQDADSHITKLTYKVWNANEVSYTGAHECMGAWYESDLGSAFPHFQYKTLKTDTAYFRATPTASRLCNQGSQKAAMEGDIGVDSVVGVQVNDVGGAYQSSSNLVNLGSGTTYTTEPVGKGQILWDDSGADYGKK
ncbi:exported hypothetical protein [Crenothrix polyspora]|uniref:Uncharacterized protein n=1 Tax=Crenothrix polyspora TaxID=360316 RepID=A0A1R4H589_9GAMM|nr:hypothetical protein [Crenothrix polyspora]SJM91211.1 exported hypothetical protein [Crenothrix polyspora]